MGTPADRAALRRASCRAGCATARGDLAPDDAAKVETPPAARPRLEARRDAGPCWSTRPRMADHLDAASVAHGERVQAGLRALGHRLRGRRVASCGASTTTRTPLFEFQSDVARQRPVHDRRRRPLRRPHRAARRSAHARHRLRLRHRARPARLRRRGRVRRARRARSTCFVVDVTDGARRGRAHPGAARGRGVAPTAPSTARSMKAQMKAADRSRRRLRRSSSASRRWPTAPSPSATSQTGEPDGRRPATSSSTTSGRCWSS